MQKRQGIYSSIYGIPNCFADLRKEKKERIYTEQGTKELLAHAHWHWDDITYPFTVIYAMYDVSIIFIILSFATVLIRLAEFKP